MSNMFSDRIADVPRSFIREILKVAIDPSTISFAGGLPNRNLFPLKELQSATNSVFQADGMDSLQYSNTEGYGQLREYISRRYREKQGLSIPVEDILITSGSQQGLDLLGKIFLNEGDDVIIEEPGYLGAIQSFSVFRASFNAIPLTEKGLDTALLADVVSKKRPKLFYTVPNFQNPTGITYSEENRKEVAGVLQNTGTLLIEDNPYGELRFSGTGKTSFKTLLPNNVILLGSFSKIVAPSFRLGWIVAPKEIMDKLIVAKQAADLHTNYFAQRVVAQYLADNDLDGHIRKINAAYGKQCGAMLDSFREFFPEGVTYTKPEGGMFVWAMLPKNLSSMDLFDLAIQDKVAFVPGNPFYVGKTHTSTMRLNFSCADEAMIREGVKRLGHAMKKLLR